MVVRIPVETGAPYEVVVGPGALRFASDAVTGASATVVVSDENVAPLHRARLGRVAQAPLVVVPAGEGSKSLAQLGALLERLSELGLDRRACVLALGGGVVGDMAGLAASLFLRGVALVQCPTTLLAQVDAAVGGKTAVNLSAGKNLAGTFHQPHAVLADTATLATLPEVELASGLGEVVKSALVGDESLLAVLEEGAARLLARDEELLAEVVARSVRVKARLVAADEREADERRLLNLGHTFAHAIELVAGYGAVPHGVAVAVGLALACEASMRVGLLEDRDLGPRLARLLALLGLPASLDALRARSGLALAAERLAAAFRSDKKAERGRPGFVLPVRAGRLVSGVPLEPELLAELLR